MDWIGLLDSNSIEYVTRGSNTKRGEVSVRCPWCGEDDPSQHLGISLEHERWGCHRNATHRGKSPIRLIAALLNCSVNQARLIAVQYGAVDPAGFDALPALNLTSKAPTPIKAPLRLPPEFRAISHFDRFWHYLCHRGFDDAGGVIAEYHLKCAVTGRFKDRVIIPFYQDGQLIGWTGRAIINPVSAPRYLSSGAEVKKTVFNEDALRKGGELLFITEGPFDAIKVDFYGQELGARATCTFGTSMSMDQLSILAELPFKKKVVLFDHDAIEPMWTLGEWLNECFIGELPPGIKDPGDLDEKQVVELVRSQR